MYIPWIGNVTYPTHFFGFSNPGNSRFLPVYCNIIFTTDQGTGNTQVVSDGNALTTDGNVMRKPTRGKVMILIFTLNYYIMNK